TFTTWDSGDEMQPTSLAFIDGVLYRADTRGYVLKHTLDLYNDPVIDTAVAAGSWEDKAVIYDYTSCAYAFNDEINKKWVTKLTALFKNNYTNASIQFQGCNDDSGTYKDLAALRFRSNFVWGDDEVIWGDEDLVWNWQGIITAERRFPKKYLRCMYKQVKITNANTILCNSDDWGDATVNASAKTVLLDNAATEDWPDNIIGYSIYFDSDNYDKGYEITIRAADTLTVSDTDGTLVDGSQSWVIKGYRRGEKIELQSYTIVYLPHGESTLAYQSGESGENA
ncbi:MAG: hypothetical protein GY861_09585, partial [bacterium]|nr:hypothetical protein [bacterium]